MEPRSVSSMLGGPSPVSMPAGHVERGAGPRAAAMSSSPPQRRRGMKLQPVARWGPTEVGALAERGALAEHARRAAQRPRWAVLGI
jgi:hypothetical protein